MDAHDVRIRADDATSPLEGGESAKGRIPGYISFVEVEISESGAAVLREAPNKPWRTAMQPGGVFELDIPEGSRAGKFHSARNSMIIGVKTT